MPRSSKRSINAPTCIGSWPAMTGPWSRGRSRTAALRHAIDMQVAAAHAKAFISSKDLARVRRRIAEIDELKLAVAEKNHAFDCQH
jgi:hypothetical protein